MKFFTATLIVLLPLTSFSAASAEKGLTTTVAAGLNITDGNSETMQANATIITEGETSLLKSVRMGIEANYGETTVDEVSDTTVENAKAYANFKKTIVNKTFAYMDISGNYDDIALIDYRITVGPGVGIFISKTAKLSVSVELGASYLWEEVAGIDDDYFAMRFAERIDYKISDTAKVWQSLEYIPREDKFDDFLLNAELGAEAALNSWLNLRCVLQNKHDSEPATADIEENDLSLVAGISFKL